MAKVQILEIESVLREQELYENGVAEGSTVGTPEWLAEMLKAAWQAGNSAGDMQAWSGGLYKTQNPFMTVQERFDYYGSVHEPGRHQ